MVSSVVMVFALTKLDTLLLIIARVFRSKRGDRFFAPFTERARNLFGAYGLFGNFLEDLPQVVLQLVKKNIFFLF